MTVAVDGPAAMPPRRALLVANPNSRAGDGALSRALASLSARDVAVIATACGSAAEVSPAIVAHRAEVDCVIVAGGDGTMNAAAKGLVETGLPLGILPLGTANDLARTLAIPADLDAAAEIIARGRVRRIDIGDVNGHPFFNVASLGLSSELARSLSPEAKRRYGRLSYAFAALRVLLGARPFGALIVGGGGTVAVRTLQIAVGNGRYYGGGMTVEQNAAIDDHHLDLYSLEFRRIWRLLFMARAFREGTHGLWREVRTARCTSFEVRTRRPRPINTDGELVTFTPARFTVVPRAVAVFAAPRLP